jgi:hypothetical protein
MMMAHKGQLIFSIFFLLVIFGVPLSQAAIEICDGHIPGILTFFTHAPTQANLRTSEKELESASVPARIVRPWMQRFWLQALGNAGDKALVGRDGWLFYAPDVRYLVESDGKEKGPFQAILQFRDQLAGRGIRLMILPMPGKPSIYSDELTHRTIGSSPTQQLIERLRDAGIETVDLFSLFRVCALRGGGYCYLARDTHWSGAAAQFAAELVARRLIDIGWVSSGSVDYQVRPVTTPRTGDLTHMINLPGLERRFPAEQVLCEQVFRSGTGELYRDKPDSEILVLGDSFLRMYQTDQPLAAGFIAHLARALKQPVTSIVNDGGASTLVRQDLSRRAGLLANKKTVIWEFVERDIRFGMEGWKDVSLP